VFSIRVKESSSLFRNLRNECSEVATENRNGVRWTDEKFARVREMNFDLI